MRTDVPLYVYACVHACSMHADVHVRAPCTRVQITYMHIYIHIHACLRACVQHAVHRARACNVRTYIYMRVRMRRVRLRACVHMRACTSNSKC